MQQAEDMNMILGVGVFTGVAGAVLVVGLWFLGWSGLSALAGLFLGFATFGAGAQVARAKRLPHWAREYMTVKPDYIKAAMVTLFGAAIMAAAIFLP
jgi:hypothetical protein